MTGMFVILPAFPGEQIVKGIKVIKLDIRHHSVNQTDLSPYSLRKDVMILIKGGMINNAERFKILKIPGFRERHARLVASCRNLVDVPCAIGYNIPALKPDDARILTAG